MHDDLATLLRTSADEIHVPEERFNEVLRDGQRRKIVRRMLGSGAALLLILGTWAAWSNLTPLEESASKVNPANNSGLPGIDRRLVVVPAPEGAGPAGSPEDVADARAVTFAFHTLLRTVGYEFDYKDFERLDQGWLVWFEDGPTAEDLRELVSSRRHSLKEFAGYLEDEIEGLEQLRLDLENAGDDKSEADRITRQIGEARESILSYQEALDETRAELESATEDLQDALVQGPNRIELTVAREGEWMVIADVSGPFAENDELLIRRHRERARDVDVHGTDWYNVRLVGPGVVDDVSGVEAFGFTTTPIPSPYREECLIILRDESGAVVYRPRDVHDAAMGAPPSEDRRDEWVMGSGIDYKKVSKPYDRLIPDFECHEG